MSGSEDPGLPLFKPHNLQSRWHEQQRENPLRAAPQVGERYSAEHTRYDEGTRYLYRDGAHELTLFWTAPSTQEIEGFLAQSVEFGLLVQVPVACLLFKILGVCEWSDVAFNIQRLPENERELPNEPPGERARVRMTLVDAADGIVRAKRLVSMDKVMTQALRHAMTEQAQAPFNRLSYDATLEMLYARFPDSDAMAHAAEVLEPAHG